MSIIALSGLIIGVFAKLLMFIRRRTHGSFECDALSRTARLK